MGLLAQYVEDLRAAQQRLDALLDGLGAQGQLPGEAWPRLSAAVAAERQAALALYGQSERAMESMSRALAASTEALEKGRLVMRAQRRKGRGRG